MSAEWDNVQQVTSCERPVRLASERKRLVVQVSAGARSRSGHQIPVEFFLRRRDLITERGACDQASISTKYFQFGAFKKADFNISVVVVLLTY